MSRAEAPAQNYRVFYIGADARDRTRLTEKERSDLKGLDTLEHAIVDELKERGFQVTSRPADADIDAYLTFGYSTNGERGTNHYYQPTQRHVVNGQVITIPGTSSSTPYAHEDQSIWVEIYDWVELRAARFEFGRVRPAWKGRMEMRLSGMDGMMREEASLMAMNLLADFPNARSAGIVKREVFGPAARAMLRVSMASPPRADAGPSGPAAKP